MSVLEVYTSGFRYVLYIPEDFNFWIVGDVGIQSSVNIKGFVTSVWSYS